MFTGVAPAVQSAVNRVGPIEQWMLRRYFRLDTVVSPRTQQYWMGYMQATPPS